MFPADVAQIRGKSPVAIDALDTVGWKISRFPAPKALSESESLCSGDFVFEAPETALREWSSLAVTYVTCPSVLESCSAVLWDFSLPL